MRFDLPESIEMMRAGRKTQTRRRSGYWLRKKPGDRITIMHQGEYLGWTLVVSSHRERLGLITDAGAYAEGYQSQLAFLRAWKRLYAGSLLTDEVTVIEFEPVRWRDE
jgi:hypothetical protein